MRVLLVVLQKNVVAWLVLLDEIRLKHQRFDLRIRHDELKIADAAHKLARLPVVPAPRLKIRAHAVPQILRLADVDDLSRVILVQVDAGRRWQIPKFFFERHCRLLPLLYVLRFHSTAS